MAERPWVSARRDGWIGRVRTEQLGQRVGLWAELAADDPVFVGARKAAEARGRPVDEASVRFELAMPAIYEVIAAGAAIDYACWRMATALSEAQAAFDLSWTHHRVAARDERWDAHPGVWQAGVEFANMINWSRTLQERVSHTFDHRGVGLLERLAAGKVRDKVSDAFRPLDDGALGVDVRRLANYNLHRGVLTLLGTGEARVIEGRLVIPIPDRASARVSSWLELSYGEGRDAVTFGAELLAAVDRFFESMLDAFAADADDEGRCTGLE